MKQFHTRLLNHLSERSEGFIGPGENTVVFLLYWVKLFEEWGSDQRDWIQISTDQDINLINNV